MRSMSSRISPGLGQGLVDGVGRLVEQGRGRAGDLAVADELAEWHHAELLGRGPRGHDNGGAPSEIWEALPAVIVPSSLKAGLRPAQGLERRPGRMPSSAVDGDRVAPSLRDGDRSDLLAMAPFFDRVGRFFVRGGREGVLALARDDVARCTGRWPGPCSCGRARRSGRRAAWSRPARRRRSGTRNERLAAGRAPGSWTPCPRRRRCRHRRRRSSGRPGRWR